VGLSRFALRRFVLALPTLLGLLLLTFVLANYLPGEPLARLLGDRALERPEVVAAYRAEWGLDRPLPERFVTYASNLVTGNLGRSTLTQRPVSEDIASFLPATIELAVWALLLSGILGIVLGTIAAFQHRRWPDAMVRGLALLASGVPVFWLALIALQLFYLRLGWLPGPEGRLGRGFDPPARITGAYSADALLAGDFATFRDVMRHVLLPATVLAMYFLGLLARITRASTLEVLRAPYLVTARAKGLPPLQVLRVHILPNALIPTVTVLGLAVGGLLAGAVLTETVFAWPGIGRYAVDAARALDYQAVLGVTFVVGVIYVFTNAVVDVVYAALDPRIRLGR